MAKSTKQPEPTVVSILSHKVIEADPTYPAQTEHDEETTGDAFFNARVVQPNAKCAGCLHYISTRSLCMVAEVPSKCGDGSTPVTGYNPAIGATPGVSNNAPSPQASAGSEGSGSKGPVGGAEGHPDFVLQVLGDEGNLELSMRRLLDGEQDAIVKSDYAMHSSVDGFMSNMKALPKEGPARGKFITAHMNHGPFLSALQKHPQGKQVHAMLTAHLNGTANAGPKAPAKVSAVGKSLKPSKAALSGPLGAIQEAWGKLSKALKASYLRNAVVGRSGVPMAFTERLVRKGGRSLVEEFGQGLGGYLYKTRHEVRKGAAPKVIRLGAGPVAKPKPPPGHSPVLDAVRRRQMATPDAASQSKARAAGGGKVFSHSSLAQHAGVKPEAIADLAHGSQHVQDFHNKVRAQFGDKVKHLTSGQIKSAYHSTGLTHSMADELRDLNKAKMPKSKFNVGDMVHHNDLPGHAPMKVSHVRYDADTKMHQVKANGRTWSASSLKHAKKSLEGTDMNKGLSFASPEHSTAHHRADTAHGHYSISENSGNHVVQFHPKANPKMGAQRVGETKRGIGRAASFSSAMGMANAHHDKMAKPSKAMKKSLGAVEEVQFATDLIKSHKKGEPKVLGHTSTGKEVRTDAKGAEGFNEEEHNEAADIHSSIGQRISDVAYGYGGGGGYSSQRPGPAAKKYLLSIAGKHSTLAARHNVTAQKHREMRSAGSMAAMPAPIAPFGKSGALNVSNNPSDGEVAKALMNAGGANRLAMGGMLNAPMHLPVNRSAMAMDLPDDGELVKVVAEKKPEVSKALSPTVGGNLSAAWDLGHYRGE